MPTVHPDFRVVFASIVEDLSLPLLVALCALCLVAGCGATPGQGGTGGDDAMAAADAAPAPDAGIELQVKGRPEAAAAEPDAGAAELPQAEAAAEASPPPDAAPGPDAVVADAACVCPAGSMHNGDSCITDHCGGLVTCYWIAWWPCPGPDGGP